MMRSVSALVLLAALAACAEEPPPYTQPIEAPGAATTTTDAPSTTSTTVGGDGSEIRLLPLTENIPDLGGELGCSFSDDGAPLLIAMGVVASQDPARAAINHAGSIETLQAQGGGYDAIVDNGATFVGRGVTIRITPSAEQTTGTEETRHTATLLFQRADGAERTYPGVWTCGP